MNQELIAGHSIPLYSSNIVLEYPFNLYIYKKYQEMINRYQLRILVLFITVAFAVSCKNPATDQAKTSDNQANMQRNTSSINGAKDVKLPSFSIKPNQKITSPFKVEINSEGIWKANEGELGTVSLYDASGRMIARDIMRSKDGNWMVDGSAAFESTLTFKVDKKQNGRIEFQNTMVTEEGGGDTQIYEMPVLLGYDD